MPRKKEVELSIFSDVPSSELLFQFHAAKVAKNKIVAEQIASEFSRRDLITVNESILRKTKESIIPVIEIAPRQHRPRKTRSKSNCNPHNFNMVQESFLAGMLKMEMCSMCGLERIAK